MKSEHSHTDNRAQPGGEPVLPTLQTVLRGRPRSHESYGALVWRKFRRNKVAIAGGLVVVGLFVLAIFADFFLPTTPLNSTCAILFARPPESTSSTLPAASISSLLSTKANKSSTPT
ncbi:MAG: hypothetical protein ACKO4U_11850 [Caldilinea sp.]